MEKLLREQSPLHGRLQRFHVDPLAPEGAAEFIDAATPREWVERYAVSGGMPSYLADLGRGGPLARLLREQVLDRHGALFNEPPYVLQQELRRPGFYLSILPVTAPARAVGYRYRLSDGFFRFWFRFVRPFRDELEAGMIGETETQPDGAFTQMDRPASPRRARSPGRGSVWGQPRRESRERSGSCCSGRSLRR